MSPELLYGNKAKQLDFELFGTGPMAPPCIEFDYDAGRMNAVYSLATLENESPFGIRIPLYVGINDVESTRNRLDTMSKIVTNLSMLGALNTISAADLFKKTGADYQSHSAAALMVRRSLRDKIPTPLIDTHGTSNHLTYQVIRSFSVAVRTQVRPK